jgi:hypothetical protein
MKKMIRPDEDRPARDNDADELVPSPDDPISEADDDDDTFDDEADDDDKDTDLPDSMK